jgi:ABC-type phosphate transport system permease subunit
LLLLAVLLLPARAVACELIYDAVKEAHREYVKL